MAELTAQQRADMEAAYLAAVNACDEAKLLPGWNEVKAVAEATFRAGLASSELREALLGDECVAAAVAAIERRRAPSDRVPPIAGADARVALAAALRAHDRNEEER